VYEPGLAEDPTDLDELVKGFRFEDSVVGLGNVQGDKFSFFLPAYSTDVRVFQGKILDEGRAINGDAHETRKSIEKTFHFDFSMEHLGQKVEPRNPRE